MNRIDFYAGERKLITAVVRARNPRETVVITRAEYKLTKVGSDISIESGTCEIDGSKIAVLLGVTERGGYELKLTVTVGRETIIEKAYVDVGS